MTEILECHEHDTPWLYASDTGCALCRSERLATNDRLHRAYKTVQAERDRLRRERNALIAKANDRVVQLCEERDEARRYARLYRKLANNEHELVSVLAQRLLALEKREDGLQAQH